MPSDPPPNDPPQHLAGERVAIAGPLASMSRSEAARLITQHGGQLAPRPDDETTLLVRGDETDPQQLDDSLRRNLESGQLVVVDETQLWRRLGLVDDSAGVSRLYTPALLAEMVQVAVRDIRRWHRRGYLVAVCEVRKLPYFDFSELRVARRLADLLHAGLSLAAIDRQMAELVRVVPDVERPLAELALVVEGGRLYLRRGGELSEPSGQLLIDFDAAENRSEEPPSVAASMAHHAHPPLEELRHLAFDLQDDGEPRLALTTLRSVLLSGEATAEDHFLAADLLYQMGDASAARERYFMAIELDDDYVEARANLGCVLMELGDLEWAAAAFRGALERHPDFTDAHYHLAHTLDLLGEPTAAVTHWKMFLNLAPASPWAEEARSRLADGATVE